MPLRRQKSATSTSSSSPKTSFCEFLCRYIIDVLLTPTNINLRSKGKKPTNYEEILQLFLFECAMVVSAEQHSVLQPNVSSIRRDMFKKYGIYATWPCADRLQEIRSHLRYGYKNKFLNSV